MRNQLAERTDETVGPDFLQLRRETLVHWCIGPTAQALCATTTVPDEAVVYHGFGISIES